FDRKVTEIYYTLDENEFDLWNMPIACVKTRQISAIKSALGSFIEAEKYNLGRLHIKYQIDLSDNDIIEWAGTKYISCGQTGLGRAIAQENQEGGTFKFQVKLNCYWETISASICIG